jgi:hypothetical protein
MRSWKSKILLIIVAVLLLIQFIRPDKNLSADETKSMATKYEIPESVNSILQKSCYDCHSNKTAYPWYSEIQPVGWWLSNHVEEGKGELNFSTFTTRPLAVQNHKLEEIVEMVEEGEMPLPSYTWLGLHPEANLTAQEKQEIIGWAKAQMDVLKQTYPPDSLVLKRRGT